MVSPVHHSGRVQRGELVEGSNYHLQLEAVLKMTANVHNRTRTRSRRQKQKTPMDTYCAQLSAMREPDFGT